jgi:hypothetical protein
MLSTYYSGFMMAVSGVYLGREKSVLRRSDTDSDVVVEIAWGCYCDVQAAFEVKEVQGCST